MSFDLFLFRVDKPHADPLDLIRRGEPQTDSMGSPAEVRSALSQGFEGIEWTESGWGDYEGDGYRVSVHVPENAPVRHLMLNLYGDHAFLRHVAAVCRQQGWLAYDPQIGRLLELENPSPAGVLRFEQFLSDVADVVSEPDARPDAQPPHSNL